jgi:Protein of unknown function (DUF4238)
MSDGQLRHDHHYVPRLYLKRFAAADHRIWTYHTLVSHPRVPLWKSASIRGVAHHQHLYTRIALRGETDDVECWLDQEFETPAEEALQRATSGARLTPADWKCLVRFLAAQDVRTPARLAENLPRWHATLPDLMKGVLQKAADKLEAGRQGEEVPSVSETPDSESFPLRVRTEVGPGKEGELKTEVPVGRSLWLWSICHVLTHTVEVLQRQRFTILRPPRGLTWFTSDDPVVRLNFHSMSKYDFLGGWGSPGTEIFLPLSPTHLLYAQVDHRPPSRGDRILPDHAEFIRRVIAEHAHRMIFAASPDFDVLRLRPRIVNADLRREEREQWSRWHEEQSAAEKDLMGPQ